MRADLLVIGGGPAGAAAALYGKQAGLSVIIVEKNLFPREKICGDGLSTFTTNRLKELNLFEDFLQLPHCRIQHMTFGTPNGLTATISTSPKYVQPPINGFTCRRLHFDNLLFEKATRAADRFIHGKAIGLQLTKSGCNGALIKGENGSTFNVQAQTIIAADGYPSFVTQHSPFSLLAKEDMMVAVRAYYHSVDFQPDTIEMHFPKEICPGYIWIFPAGKEEVNVGICLPQMKMKQLTEPLKNVFQKLLISYFPRERFTNAVLSEPIKGGILPLGDVNRPMGIPGLLLCGDAAGLIDPCSGEGIGNAMTSARLAIQAVIEAQSKEETVRKYEEKIRAKFAQPFFFARKLQQIASRPFLLNFLGRRAHSSEFVREWLSGVMSDSINRNELLSVRTYIKLLAGKHSV